MLEALALTIGLNLNGAVGSDENISYKESPSIKLELGNKLYGWGEFSKGSNYILGQKVSSSYVFGAGVGYNFEITPKTYWFLEGGIGYPLNVNNRLIQQEVTYTYLVGRHNVDESRPVPVPNTPYDQEAYSSDWDIDYGLVARTGLKYSFTENFGISASYKYFNPRGYIAIWDEELRNAGGGWWEENVSVNMNVVELGLHYKF
jgi:opacity protein-like surface antigen